MGGVIPFLYYDIFARIIPGAITLGVIRMAHPNVFGPLSGVWTGSSTDGWRTVVVPFVFVGGCYFFGFLYEVVFVLPGFKSIADARANFAFRKAWSQLGKRPCTHTYTDRHELKRNRTVLWKTLQDKGGIAFSHLLRFQAETKMCLHCTIPLFIFVLGDLYRWMNWPHCTSVWPPEPALGRIVVCGLVLAVVVAGAYLREVRRWVDVIGSIDQLRDNDRSEIVNLALLALGGTGKKKVHPGIPG